MITDTINSTRQIFYCELRSFPIIKIKKIGEKIQKIDILPPEEQADIATFLYMGALDENEEREPLEIWQNAKTANAYLYLSIVSFIKHEYTEGFELLEKSCDLGGKIAMLRVAICCSLGIGTEVDPERAYNIFKELTLEDSEPTATYFYGSMIMLGSFPFVTEPMERGFAYIKEAEENGCKYAEFEKAVDMLKSAQNDAERQSAYSLVKSAADKCEPRAMMFYATLLSKGEVKEESPLAVKKYIDSCAVLGYEPAIEALKLVQQFKKEQDA